VDENMMVTNLYSIKSVPTILFFKNGKVVDRVVGNVAKVVLTKKLNGLLDRKLYPIFHEISI